MLDFFIRHNFSYENSRKNQEFLISLLRLNHLIHIHLNILKRLNGTNSGLFQICNRFGIV